MKFARFFSAAATASLFLAASAAPHGGSPAGQCNSGPTVCCKDVQLPGALDVRVGALLGLLGIKISGLNGLIGSGCSTINLLGLGSDCPAQQQLCCQDNFYNGLINVGCVPINVSL